jgi:hypothetical protein
MKALIVVLVVAAGVFWFFKPVMLRFFTESDYQRRRNAWILVTIIAFLCSNFWIFACAAALIYAFCSKRDSNPPALYLFLLSVVPPVSVVIPLGGSSQLLPVDNALLLSLFVMIPAGRRLAKKEHGWRSGRFGAIDWFLIAHGLFTSVFYIHLINLNGTFYPTTVWDFARRVITFLLGTFVPYFVISRTTRDSQQIRECMAALVLSCMLMAAIAVFESMKGWLLYEMISNAWDTDITFSSYLMRGSMLRAMASSGHSLSLGYFLSIAIGFWLCLQPVVESRRGRLAVVVLLSLGLIAAFSRGPWICAIGIYFAYSALQPKASAALFRATLGVSFALGIVVVSPIGKQIVDVIPFLGGHTDNDSILYRQRLWDRCIDLISNNPMLGDPFALAKMQDLRQGQGIIDLVNLYVTELLGGGLIGLGLFLSATILALVGTWIVSRQNVASASADYSGEIGSSLMACLLGSLFLWGFGGVNEHVLWALVALAIAYMHLKTGQIPKTEKLTK